MRRAVERAFGEPPRFHGIHGMKYRAAATLGEQVLVTGSLVSCDAVRGRSRWQFAVTSSDPSRVFISTEVTLSWPGEAALPRGYGAVNPVNELAIDGCAGTPSTESLPTEFCNQPKSLQVVAWSDDLDGGRLCIHAALNFFERMRTLSLGRSETDGELGLMRLYNEGISVVVRFGGVLYLVPHRS